MPSVEQPPAGHKTEQPDETSQGKDGDTAGSLTSTAIAASTAKPVTGVAPDVLAPSPEHWPQLLEQLDLRGMVHNIAANMELVSVDGDAMVFVLDSQNASLFNEGHRDKIRAALQNYLGREVSVAIELGEPTGETPAMRSARATHERQQQAVVEIESDPRLQALITRFDGELDRHSITPLES
jgi:DNA polymerase-3 subunit gamma/tau